MPKVRALNPGEAERTLVARFGPRADRLRQLLTKTGLRPTRVFLVWQFWTGVERGEGTIDPTKTRVVELLPTPKVVALDNIQNVIAASGGIPTNLVRVSGVSVTYSHDVLSGYRFPDQADKVPEPHDFFYELQMDDRHRRGEERMKFRIASPPSMNPGNVEWVLNLERISEDRSRAGNEQPGTNID